MNLAKTTLAADLVAKLAEFNIRDVGQLLAAGEQPTGLLALADLLHWPVAQVRALLDRLKKEYPKAVPPKAPARDLPFGLIETRNQPK
jgi:hypothetical protein